MMPLAYRLFIDPVDVFVGPGWLVCLPLLVFAAAWVYHILRCENTVAWGVALRQSAWLSLKVLLALAALTAVLWLT